MSSELQLVSDGSSPEDAHDVVEIDRTDAIDRYRFTCPNGHISWDKTNNHIWCPSCRRQAEAGDEIDAEHWKIYDKRAGEFIPWHAVVVVQEELGKIPKDPPTL